MNKRGIDFNFAWMFGIIVGAVIMIIAVYATVSLITTSRVESDTKVAAQLGIILNPIETNLEDSKYVIIGFPDETQVFNGCRTGGNFGQQTLRTAVKSGVGDAFQESGIENSFFNKYIFSESVVQGEELHVIVKPFELPYKVADLVFAYTDEYCFVNPPGFVEDEITRLGAAHINLSSSVSECPRESTTVCFANTGCDIHVNAQSQIVVKDNAELYYDGSLLYGAIFASPDIYECHVERLTKRAAELGHVYAEKAEFLSGKGCSSNLAQELRNFARLAQVNHSREFALGVAPFSETLRRKNDALSCRLF